MSRKQSNTKQSNPTSGQDGSREAPPNNEPRLLNAGRPIRPRTGEHGLVLDDFLLVMDDARKIFGFHPAKFSLKELGSYPGAAAAVERFIRDARNWLNGEVFVDPSMLAELGTQIYKERTGPADDGRQKVSPDSIELVLRRALELGLQTIVQWPSRDSKTKYDPKRVLSLSSALVKLGAKVGGALRAGELRERIHVLFEEDQVNRRQLLQIGEEMQSAGKTLQTIAKAKLRRRRLASPNPQVRFALYVAGWIRRCTGRWHYALLKTLMDAAFHSAGKTIPRWVDRLEIEMNVQRNRRKQWIQTISS